MTDLKKLETLNFEDFRTLVLKTIEAKKRVNPSFVAPEYWESYLEHLFSDLDVAEDDLPALVNNSLHSFSSMVHVDPKVVDLLRESADKVSFYVGLASVEFNLDNLTDREIKFRDIALRVFDYVYKNYQCWNRNSLLMVCNILETDVCLNNYCFEDFNGDVEKMLHRLLGEDRALKYLKSHRPFVNVRKLPLKEREARASELGLQSV